MITCREKETEHTISYTISIDGGYYLTYVDLRWDLYDIDYFMALMYVSSNSDIGIKKSWHKNFSKDMHEINYMEFWI